MKHTQGKWRIDGGTNEKGDLFIWKDGEYYGGHAIATIHGEIQEGAKGNARLIATAPDLLEALKFTQTALANWRDGKDVTRHPIHGELNLEEVKYCVIDKAIAAAEK